MPAPMPPSLSRRRFVAVTLGAFGAAVPTVGAETQPYPEGLLVFDGEEFLELGVYASLQASGVLSMAFGAVDEIPVVERVPMLICSLGMWYVGSVWFTSSRVFDDGRAERRRLTFALNRVNMRTTRLRIRSLEDARSVDGLLRGVKADADHPGYAVFAVTNGAVVRHYLVQVRPAEA